jgi:hypothetical protein
MAAISGSVGSGGANRADDVVTVQLLLNDWRESQGIPLIKVDGLVGPESIKAITGFQEKATGIVDGRVDVGGPALSKLAEAHVSRVLNQLRVALSKVLGQLDQALVMYLDVLPPSTNRALVEIRALVAQFGQGTSGLSASPAAPTVRLGFAIQHPIIFANTLAPPLVALAALMAVVLALMAMMAILNAAKLIARVAEEIAKAIANLMQKIKEAVFQAVNELEKAFEKASDLLKNKCRPKLDKMLEQFARMITLIDAFMTKPPPPHLREKVLEAILDELQKFIDMVNELALCLGLRPPTIPLS